MTSRRFRRAHAGAIALVLAAAVTALVSDDRKASSGGEPSAAATLAPAPAPGDATPQAPGPVVEAPPASGPSALLSTDEGGRVAAASSKGSKRFADLFPSQVRATADPAVPATNHWALLIGINDYAGGTRDNVGSYQDARTLRSHLRSLEWRSDHIVLLGNRDATASMILQAVRWLASKTDGSSVVVFHYAGHEKPRTYGGTRHIMLWAADNRLIADTTLAREIGRVRAARMWIDLAVCRAGGFEDPGLVKPGRVVTYSSPERELSYEDPRLHHSVFGWYLIQEGMVEGLADANRDGVVTVEEAFKYARPLVTEHTLRAQHPLMDDAFDGGFSLVPPEPPPPPPPSPEPTPGCFLFC